MNSRSETGSGRPFLLCEVSSDPGRRAQQRGDVDGYHEAFPGCSGRRLDGFRERRVESEDISKSHA